MNSRYFSHEDIKGKFVAVRQKAIAIYNEINEQNFRYEFPTDKWNICQHFDHLLKFGEYHISLLDRALLKIIDNRLFSSDDFIASPDEERLISRISDIYEEFYSSSYLFQPDSNLSRGSVFIKFVSMQDLFISQLNMAEGYSLDNFAVEVTIDHGYNLRPGAAFLLIASYESRHLGFAQKLAEEILSENVHFI